MSATAAATHACAAFAFRDVLKRTWPRHTAKLAARAADVSPRTAERWVNGQGLPTWAAMVRLMQANECLARDLRDLAHARRDGA
jgi:hypothetical protein